MQTLKAYFQSLFSYEAQEENKDYRYVRYYVITVYYTINTRQYWFSKPFTARLRQDKNQTQGSESTVLIK